MNINLKNLILRQLLIVLLFISCFAQAQENNQEIDQTNSDVIVLPLKNGEKVIINKIPDMADMKVSLGLSVTDKIRKKIEDKGGVLEEVDPLMGWKNLSFDKQQKFSKLREIFLKQAVSILDKMNGLVGAGIVIGESIKFVVKKTKGVFVKVQNNEKTKISMNQRKRITIENIVRAIDYKMWFQAPLLISANEFGIQASVGIIGLGGVQKKGGGGLEELGISLAYNKESKAFVFEVFHNGERFDSAAMPAFNVGINFKGGVVMRSSSNEIINKSTIGTSFYPPAFPGSTSYGADSYNAGFASGIGFPPPPIGDLLTFTNKFERTALVKISISPFIRGFFRVGLGDMRTPIKSIAYRFVDIFNALKYLISKKSTVDKNSTQNFFDDKSVNSTMTIMCEQLF